MLATLASSGESISLSAQNCSLQSMLTCCRVRLRSVSFERVEDSILIRVEPFPADCITPTFKTKRNVVAKTFRKELDELYERAEKQGRSKL